jgi:hypothetical protein
MQNILLSYLKLCLVVHDPTKPIIDQSTVTQRTRILNSIICHDNENEIQALYAIQKVYC